MHNELLTIEREIAEIEYLYDNFSFSKEKLSRYTKLLQAHEKYISESKFDEYDIDFTSERTRALSYDKSQRYKIIKSRIFEMKAVLCFADDKVLNAREYIGIAKQKLPMNEQLYSKLGRSYDSVNKSTFDNDWERIKRFSVWFVWGIIALFVIWFMTQPASDETYAPDYCDINRC